MAQDATSESIINRGLGFIDKIAELCDADGKTVSIEGNDKYVSDSKVEKADNADVIIDVAVPAQVTSELSSLDVQTMLNKKDTIAIFGTNQHSSEGMVTGNENLNKFGPDDDQVIAIGFDSSEVINNAVKSGEFIGAITQAPVKIGETVVELCVKTANGEDVSDVDTGCQWFTADNMEDKEIAENLIE
jgi:ribose transport system substrate-binding protein